MIDYIMLALLCVWTVSLLLNFGESRDLKVLNYSLLNQEETISISLESHFKSPFQVVVDDDRSSENIRKILDFNFTKKSITKISSLVLRAKLADNTTVDFSNRTLIK